MKTDSDLILFAQGLLNGPRRLLYRFRNFSRPGERTECEDLRRVSGALSAYYGSVSPEAATIRFAARDKALAWRDRTAVLLIAALAVTGAAVSWTMSGYSIMPTHCATIAPAALGANGQTHHCGSTMAVVTPIKKPSS